MVDLNCDMGEGFGIYSFAEDEEIMPFIDAANVACGFHASDPNIMRKTVELAKKHNVKVGAHPSYPDLVGFGRRPMGAIVASGVADFHDGLSGRPLFDEQRRPRPSRQ